MMIEVNLLPAELRRVERTPLPRFLTIIVGTILVMTTAAFAVIVNLRKIPDLKQSENALVVEIGALQKQEKEYDQLNETIARFEDRKQAVADLWHKRVLWAKKLSELCDLTPRYVGLKEIKLTETRNARLAKGDEKPGGTLVLDTISAGADHSRLATYRQILRGEEPPETFKDAEIGKDFYAAFMKMEPTATKLVELDDYEEKQALEFQLELTLKGDEKRLEEALKTWKADRKDTKDAAASQAAPASVDATSSETGKAPTDATDKQEGPVEEGPSAKPVATKEAT